MFYKDYEIKLVLEEDEWHIVITDEDFAVAVPFDNKVTFEWECDVEDQEEKWLAIKTSGCEVHLDNDLWIRKIIDEES